MGVLYYKGIYILGNTLGAKVLYGRAKLSNNLEYSGYK